MPASLRTAFKTARADAPPLPGPAAPKQKPDAAIETGPGPIDPRTAAIFTGLGANNFRPGRSLSRLTAAIAMALDAGWDPDALIEILKNTADPEGRHPLRIWIWTCERLGTPATTNGGRS